MSAKQAIFNDHRDDLFAWLLEDDPNNPGVRYFAMRDLQGNLTNRVTGGMITETQSEIKCVPLT
jgi:hypothetical protein